MLLVDQNIKRREEAYYLSDFNEWPPANAGMKNLQGVIPIIS